MLQTASMTCSQVGNLGCCHGLYLAAGFTNFNRNWQATGQRGQELDRTCLMELTWETVLHASGNHSCGQLALRISQIPTFFLEDRYSLRTFKQQKNAETMFNHNCWCPTFVWNKMESQNSCTWENNGRIIFQAELSNSCSWRSKYLTGVVLQI